MSQSNALINTQKAEQPNDAGGRAAAAATSAPAWLGAALPGRRQHGAARESGARRPRVRFGLAPSCAGGAGGCGCSRASRRGNGAAQCSCKNWGATGHWAAPLVGRLPRMGVSSALQLLEGPGAHLAARLGGALGGQRRAARQQQAHVGLKLQGVEPRLEALARHAVAVDKELGVAAEGGSRGQNGQGAAAQAAQVAAHTSSSRGSAAPRPTSNTSLPTNTKQGSLPLDAAGLAGRRARGAGQRQRLLLLEDAVDGVGAGAVDLATRGAGEGQLEQQQASASRHARPRRGCGRKAAPSVACQARCCGC